MGQKEKLIAKLKSRPKNFTFEEAERLMGFLEYIRSNKGKTSGSRVMFYKDGATPVVMHRPHPQKELKIYQIDDLLEKLVRNGDIEDNE